MSKYYVTFEGYAGTTVEVDADSEEQAREEACKLVGPSLCHQCASELDLGDIGEITDVSKAS